MGGPIRKGSEKLASRMLFPGGPTATGRVREPKCLIFQCVYGHSYRCCAVCKRKDTCSDPCKNDPARCGKCMLPPEKGGPRK